MMTDKIAADVRVQLLLPANLHFPEQRGIVESVRLADTEDFQITLKHSDGPQGDLLKKWRKRRRDFAGDSDYEALINHLERTLIVPQVEIVLKKRTFVKEELSIRDGRILIRGDDPKKANWFQIAKEIVIVYDSLINHLFTMFANKPWKRLESLSLSPSGPFANLSDFARCLQSWNVEFREVSGDEWVGGFSFLSEAESLERVSLQIASADIGSEQLQTIAEGLKSLIGNKASLPTGWEYLYLASLHLNRGDVRNTIIDLDIAVDYLVKRYIRDRVSICEEAINIIFEKSSTGNLLTIAKMLSSSDSESAMWDAFEKLHGFRNEVLHNYRRRFGASELKIIERSQNDILSLLRDLAVSSSTG